MTIFQDDFEMVRKRLQAGRAGEPARGRRAALCVRDSAVQQDQSSLASQVEACVRQATEDGAPTLVDAYVFRDQQSGTSLDRPGLNGLRRAVRSGEVGVVYVCSADRLACNVIHLGLLVYEFALARVKLRYAK